MTLPAIFQITDGTLPVAPTPRVSVNEVIGVVGTGEGARTGALPVNTPYHFNRVEPLGGQTADDARDSGNWTGVYANPATDDAAHKITDSLDFAVREILSHINEEVVVVRVPGGASGAAPTDAAMEAGIRALRRSQSARTAGFKPTVLLVDYLGYPRASANPYAAQAQAAAYLDDLDSVARDLDGVAVIGAAPTFSGGDISAWGRANRHPKTIAVGPANGTDADTAKDPSVSYAVSMLVREAQGGGRGVSLNLMDAIGYTGQIPSLSQSFTATTDDVSGLNNDGITAAFFHNGWHWKGVTFNQMPSNPIAADEIVSVERIQSEITEVLLNTAVLAAQRNITAQFFAFVTGRVNAYLSGLVAAGRIAAGACAPAATPIVNGTEAAFTISLGLHAPAISTRFTRFVQLQA